MRIIQNFEDSELESLLEEFYRYFKTGFEFEEFLKPFLECIGLTEVAVTKKTGDGGVDLLAVKNGLEEINNLDNVKYKVQAKCYNPKKNISPEKIDALRGNLSSNEKGLFFTTAKVSKNAKENAISKDPSKPVIVIDGIDLVRLCIEKQIGFAYKPLFSKSALDEFTCKNKSNTSSSVQKPATISILQKVTKLITSNDIRVHIISVPRAIIDKITNNTVKHNVKLIVNNNEEFRVTFCPSRNYISTVTDIFKKYGLLQDDGTIIERKAEWAIDENQTLYINLL